MLQSARECRVAAVLYAVKTSKFELGQVWHDLLSSLKMPHRLPGSLSEGEDLHDITVHIVLNALGARCYQILAFNTSEPTYEWCQ